MSGRATTPVAIVTGSFASGKTTLCNRWAQALRRQERRAAVIAHRFAEEYACQANPVDQQSCSLVEEIYDFGSGCLCCTPGGELSMRLENFRMWGETYDHILLRVGPLADPLLFATAAQRGGGYVVEGIVAVVDAHAVLHEGLLEEAVARHQIAVADVVLVWASVPCDEQIDEVVATLSAASPTAQVTWWTEGDLLDLLCCRPAHRAYPLVQPPPPALVGRPACHTTPFRAVQINESFPVCAAGARAWVERWLQRGCCIRLKAVLACADAGPVLLVDALRGRPPTFEEVPEAPLQWKMGDLDVLASSTTVEAASRRERVLSRVFILLGPPLVSGLGELTDLAGALPTSDELAEDFRASVALKGPAGPKQVAA